MWPCICSIMGPHSKVFDAPLDDTSTPLLYTPLCCIQLSSPPSHTPYIYLHTHPLHKVSDLEGQTALHIAARNGHVNLMRHLSQKANVQHRQRKDKRGNMYVELLPADKKLSFLLVELADLEVDGILAKVQEDDHLLWFMTVREERPLGSLILFNPPTLPTYSLDTISQPIRSTPPLHIP